MEALRVRQRERSEILGILPLFPQRRLRRRRPGAAPGGTYETRPYSVSGYVNGHNPRSAYPPTRAARGGRQARGRPSLPRRIRRRDRRHDVRPDPLRAGAPPPAAPPVPAGARGVSTLSETSGGLKYSGHGAWDGPAPRGDPTKPPPGAPYYVKAPPEPVHDPSKEEREIPLGGAAGLRLPVLGCDSAHAAHAVPLGYRHVRCGAADDPNLATAGDAVRAAPGGRDAIFISAKIAPGDVSDPAAACDAILASLRVPAVDLLSLEWPVGDADALKATWSKLEALVRAGKARAIGLTNASVPVVEAICGFAEMKPAVNEVEAHPLMAHRKLAGVCRRYGVAPAAHHPLGALDARLLQHPKLVEAAAASGSCIRRRGRGSRSTIPSSEGPPGRGSNSRRKDCSDPLLRASGRVDDAWLKKYAPGPPRRRHDGVPDDGRLDVEL